MPRRGLPTDPLASIVEPIRALERRADKLEQPDGGQLFRALEKVQQLIADLPGLVNAYLAGLTNLTVGGTVTANAGLTSSGAYALDVTTLPGARAAAWLHNSGRLGQTVSSITKKIDLTTVPFTAADVLAVQPYMFHYVAQVDIRDNPENPNHDPSYVVPWEIGYMAEHFIEHNLDLFVYFHEDGTPAGIHYAEFGAVAPIVVALEHERQIAELMSWKSEIQAALPYGLNA